MQVQCCSVSADLPLMYQRHLTSINKPFTAKSSYMLDIVAINAVPFDRVANTALDTLPPYIYYELLIESLCHLLV